MKMVLDGSSFGHLHGVTRGRTSQLRLPTLGSPRLRRKAAESGQRFLGRKLQRMRVRERGGFVQEVYW